MASQREAYQATLRALGEQLRAAEHRVEQLQRAMVTVEELLKGGAEPEPALRFAGGTSERLPSKFAGMTLTDAAAEILGEVGAPMAATDLAQRLLQDGYEYDGDWRKLKLSLVGSLDRKVKNGEGLTKPMPGVYALENGKHS